MAEQQAAQAQQLFPPPPPFYALYRPDADGSAERPLPPLPPPPPEAGEYTSFAVMHSVESGLPRLQGRQIYTTQAGGSVDVKQQLLVLHRELLANVVEKPSAYARQVENVMVVFRNMTYLTNLLRPHQARASLLATLKRDLQQRRAATAELRQLGQQADAALASVAAKVQAAAAQVQAQAADGAQAAAAAGGTEAMATEDGPGG